MNELKKNKIAFASLIFLGLLVLVAIFANILAPYPFAEQKLIDRMQGPSATHRLGTDDLGRDILSRLVYGARISLSVAVLVELVVVSIGVTVGLIAGFFGGWAETVLMRITDTLLA
ncbi:ABC transporter permease, partial [Armatimonas sp.]|uniref:ABC transporter permease n=1 Tax=Armatimonas sp. TaxID=1872638 RepID=UPI003750C53D